MKLLLVGFYTLDKRLMHLAQARTLLPEGLPAQAGKRTHCKFGYFLTLEVGLYFPLNLTRVTPIAECFLQIEQIFSIEYKIEI